MPWSKIRPGSVLDLFNMSGPRRPFSFVWIQWDAYPMNFYDIPRLLPEKRTNQRASWDQCGRLWEHCGSGKARSCHGQLLRYFSMKTGRSMQTFLLAVALRSDMLNHAETCWIMLRGKSLIMETLTIKVGKSRHLRRIHRQLLFVLKDIGGFHGKVCPWWGLSRTFRRERLMEPLRQDSHLHAMFFRLSRTRHDKTNAVVMGSSEPLQWLPFCISACRHVL